MNQSLARGLAILEAFSRDTPELGVRELSRILGMDRSVVHRLTQTLACRGFLEQNPETMRYRIGVGALELGYRYRVADTLQDAALPVLRLLTKEHQLNAYLGVLREGSALYLMALQSSGPIVIRAAPGARAPVHSTALGKVLLAAQPDVAVEEILGAGPLPRLTPKTIVRPKDLIAQLTTVRRLGYAMSDEENLPDVFAVGAGVRDSTGRVVAAISGACPRHSVPAERIPEIVRVIVAAAAEISRNIGCHATTA